MINFILLTTVTPKITCQQSEVTVFQGQRVKIVCDITANPIAQVSLTRNGNKVNHTFTTVRDTTRRDVTIWKSQIEITNHTFSGTYQIEAANSAGTSLTEIVVIVIGIYP